MCAEQMKIGDLGMARFVLPPPPPASKAPAGASAAAATMPRESRRRSPQHSAEGGANSGANTPKGPAVRTFTPGVVGTITYTAPEVLGVLDEPQQQQQQPSVEQVLKVGWWLTGSLLDHGSKSTSKSDCSVAWPLRQYILMLLRCAPLCPCTHCAPAPCGGAPHTG